MSWRIHLPHFVELLDPPLISPSLGPIILHIVFHFAREAVGFSSKFELLAKFLLSDFTT